MRISRRGSGHRPRRPPRSRRGDPGSSRRPSAIVSARARASATARPRASVSAAPVSPSWNVTPSRPVAPDSEARHRAPCPTCSRSRIVAAILFVTVKPLRTGRLPSCSQLGVTSIPAVRTSSPATPAAASAASTSCAAVAATERASAAVSRMPSTTNVAWAMSAGRWTRPVPVTDTLGRSPVRLLRSILRSALRHWCLLLVRHRMPQKPARAARPRRPAFSMQLQPRRRPGSRGP